MRNMPVKRLSCRLTVRFSKEIFVPKNKLKLLEAWIVIHHEDLEANWKLLSNGEQFFRIDPLK